MTIHSLRWSECKVPKEEEVEEDDNDEEKEEEDDASIGLRFLGRPSSSTPKRVQFRWV